MVKNYCSTQTIFYYLALQHRETLFLAMHSNLQFVMYLYSSIIYVLLYLSFIVRHTNYYIFLKFGCIQLNSTIKRNSQYLKYSTEKQIDYSKQITYQINFLVIRESISMDNEINRKSAYKEYIRFQIRQMKSLLVYFTTYMKSIN